MRRKSKPLFSIGIPVLSLWSACAPPSLPPAKSTVPDGEPGRWVVLDGAVNTRDIGGYATQEGKTVRWGMVYRSGTLSNVTQTGCDSFGELGIATVIDLRNRLSPAPLFDGDVLCIHVAARVLGFPVSFSSEPPADRQYVQGVLDNADSYRRTFEQLADQTRLPLLYHCAAGKDRSGVMTAMLLLLLGVDRQTVIDDFLLSELVWESVNLAGLEGLIDEIDASGGIEAYLAEIGVTPEVQAAIRANLIE